jgi:outer membrane protein
MKCRKNPRARAVILAAAVAAAGGAMMPAARAQDSLHVAVIDVQRLLGESRAGKVALEKLRALGEQKQAELETKRTAISELRQRLDEGRLSLSEERQVEMEKELQNGMIELQRLQDDAERALQQERAEEFERIESQVIPLIAAVAEERGYTLVFNKFQSGLLFATESVDITETILQRFDAASQPDGG